jgi:DNA adenine methylase
MYAGLPMTTKELTYYAQVKRTGVELLVLKPTLMRSSCRVNKFM